MSAAHRLLKVEQTDRFAERARRQMHVPKGHAERRVTHQLLSRLRHRAPHGEVRAEGVPEHVRADDPKPSPLAAEAERRLDGRLRERLAI
jgi:hypothetical protein